MGPRLLLLLAAAFPPLGACSDPATPAATPSATPEREAAGATATAGPFEVAGIIDAIEEDGSRASIAHEDVPDYMPAMTMPFFAGEEGQLEGFSEGDRVELRFERRSDGKHYLLSLTAAP